MILDLMQNDGLSPKRKTVKEFASACPNCGGSDRFLLFIENDKYWCRQCGKNGDAIQYLRDFHGLSFPDAAEQVGKDIQQNRATYITTTTNYKNFPKKVKNPQSKLWPGMATKLITEASKNTKTNDHILTWLKNDRGITAATAQKFHLGWLDRNIYSRKESWGIEPNGKKLFIPSGLVIPWQEKRIRIRRNNPGEHGRYYVLEGSNSEAYTVGTPYETTAIIVESELDAILLSQEIKRKSFIVALGSSSRKPDSILLESLNLCPVILVALDTDQAGANASTWWLKNLSSTYRTLTPKSYGKDITEAYLNGLDLNTWLSASMELYCEQIQKPHRPENQLQ